MPTESPTNQYKVIVIAPDDDEDEQTNPSSDSELSSVNQMLSATNPNQFDAFLKAEEKDKLVR